MTICLIALVGATFVINSNDSFNKKNPQILSNTNYTDTAGIIPLNQTYFVFKIITTSHFDTTTYFKIGKSANEIFDCKLDNSKYQTFPSYNRSILTNNYCLDFTNSTRSIEDFSFSIEYCTNNSYCKSREEINNYLGIQGVNFDYFIKSAIIKPNEYNNPITNNIKNYWTTIFPNKGVNDYLCTTPHEIFTDDGLIYSNEYSNTYNNYSYHYI